LCIAGTVTPGNRFALCDLPEGELVLQYGQPIGTSRGISAGDPITPSNLANEVPVVREVSQGLHTTAPDLVPDAERETFPGHRRADGRVGTRNWVVVLPTSAAVSHEARQIALLAEHKLFSADRYPQVDGVVALPHDRDCDDPQDPQPDVVLRTLAHTAAHPNVGAVLFLSATADGRSRLAEHVQRLGHDRPSAWLNVREVGGTRAAVERGLREIEDLLQRADATQREACPASNLVLGVECGGSDGFSGLSANPSLGRAADLLVAQGGGVLLSEVPEFCGAEHVLAARARDADVARDVYALVDWYKSYAADFGASLAENPSPGNIAGGLLNITIKSLGAIAKGGTTRVEGVTRYAEPPANANGLHLMQGPGYDQESVPGLVAAGATVVVFTTGRGTTIGNAIVPVIKLASNTPTFERLSRDIDLSAGGVIDGTESIASVGARVFERILAVARGSRSLAEEAGHREFQIWSARTPAPA
ncbi:MAG: UxaA family hydrolase, partial [Planctomycetota bacterium]